LLVCVNEITSQSTPPPRPPCRRCGTLRSGTRTRAGRTTRGASPGCRSRPARWLSRTVRAAAATAHHCTTEHHHDTDYPHRSPSPMTDHHHRLTSPINITDYTDHHTPPITSTPTDHQTTRWRKVHSAFPTVTLVSCGAFASAREPFNGPTTAVLGPRSGQQAGAARCVDKGRGVALPRPSTLIPAEISSTRRRNWRERNVTARAPPRWQACPRTVRSPPTCWLRSRRRSGHASVTEMGLLRW
jgi:hypothetical protein